MIEFDIIKEIEFNKYLVNYWKTAPVLQSVQTNWCILAIELIIYEVSRKNK